MSGSLLDAIAHPTVVNPIAAQQNALQVAAGIWQNRQSQANQLAGAAQQGAIDANGVYDPNVAAQNLSAAGPGAALAARQTLESNQGLSDAQFAQAKQKTDYLAKASAGALIAGDYSDAGIMKLLQQGSADGMMTMPQIARQLATLPPDAAGRKQWLQQHQANALSQSQALDLQYGTPGSAVGPNGAQVGTIQNRQTGAMSAPPQPGVPLGQTPGELNAIVPIGTNPDGTVRMGTQLQAQNLANGRAFNDNGTPAASGGAPAASPLGTGRLPPALLRTPAGGAAAAPGAVPAGAVPAGAAPAGAAPGAAPAAAAPTAPGFSMGLPVGAADTMTADVGQFKKDQFAIPQGQQSVQSLQKAQVALEASNTGRNSEGVHNMLATMQTLGIPTFGLADDVGSYDLAHKYLMDYARKSGAAAHSDLQLQTSEGANASTGISNQAALDVVHTNIGRERQAIAQVMEAPQTGIGYGAHSSAFASGTDPRGFALDAYKPADLNPNDPKSMVGKMTAPERDKFYRSVGIAQRLKLLNVAQPAAPAAAAAAPAGPVAGAAPQPAAPYPGQN